MDSLHRSSIPRSIDGNDPRIPIAWKRREMTFSNPYARRASSSSVTSSSSDDREEVPIVRQPYRPLSRHSNVEKHEDRFEHYATLRTDMLEQLSSNRSDRMDSHRNASYFHGPYRSSGPGSTGTLRSTRSVPALAFAAAMETAEPCPIHGGDLAPSSMRRHGSLFDIRSPPIGGMPMLDNKRLYGSKHSLVGSPPQQFTFHPEIPQYLPPHMMNPMMRHHMGMPVIMEPLSLRDRDQFNKRMAFPPNGPKGYPTKEPIDPYSVEQVCCKGHLIVLWIILGVVTVGVILGIIMGVTIT
ncbi:uncharacterized protein [Parasteatoda tepidariorum]|uniref:uncharacterized protein n=1 Tax=Parasteatoda tepidariorum TaxID=114398 RepID=UPI00077FE1C0|nr:uncharacterized protein LOC107455717 [Parasteatoda tepidariorum]